MVVCSDRGQNVQRIGTSSQSDWVNIDCLARHPEPTRHAFTHVVYGHIFFARNPCQDAQAEASKGIRTEEVPST